MATQMIVRHTVADFDAWKPAFDEDESRRTDATLEAAVELACDVATGAQPAGLAPGRDGVSAEADRLAVLGTAGTCCSRTSGAG